MAKSKPRGWWIYQTSMFSNPNPMFPYPCKIGDVWCCSQCKGTLKVIGEYLDGEAQEVGCPTCGWAVNSDNRCRKLQNHNGKGPGD